MHASDATLQHQSLQFPLTHIHKYSTYTSENTHMVGDDMNILGKNYCSFLYNFIKILINSPTQPSKSTLPLTLSDSGISCRMIRIISGASKSEITLKSTAFQFATRLTPLPPFPFLNKVFLQNLFLEVKIRVQLLLGQVDLVLSRTPRCLQKLRSRR